MGNQISQPDEREHLHSKFNHFLPVEVKEWSNTFNILFPMGFMVKKDFIEFFSKIFPLGKSERFSERLFHNINICQTDKIDLNELLIAFTILFQGSLFEKLRWIFRFYDHDKDGVISKAQLEEGLIIINEMTNYSPIKEVETKIIIEEIFKDKNDNALTFNDFESMAESTPENFKKLSFFKDY